MLNTDQTCFFLSDELATAAAVLDISSGLCVCLTCRSVSRTVYTPPPPAAAQPAVIRTRAQSNQVVYLLTSALFSREGDGITDPADPLLGEWPARRPSSVPPRVDKLVGRVGGSPVTLRCV